MNAWGANTDRILSLLEAEGPLTRAEIGQQLGIDRYNISAIVTRLLRGGKTTGRRVHISDWLTQVKGERRYPRALIALGDGPDARKPPREAKATVRKRSNDKRRARNTMNFVFNLGVPRREFHREDRYDL